MTPTKCNPVFQRNIRCSVSIRANLAGMQVAIELINRKPEALIWCLAVSLSMDEMSVKEGSAYA